MNAIFQKWVLEITLIFSAIIFTFLILFPIRQAEIDFPWLWYNFAFLIGALLLLKHLFLFRHHPLANSRLFKLCMILIAPFCFFPIIEGIHSFLEFNDREGLQSILEHLSVDRQNFFIKYIRLEYLLSSVICLLGLFALIVKMIRSLWRQYRFGIA